MNTLHRSIASRTDRLNGSGRASPHSALDLSALVGEAAWNRLSPAIRRRFAAGHADVTYRGSMELKASRMGRLFGMAAALLGSPLAASQKQAVAASVNVRNDGAGGVVWERVLGNQRVRSTKRLGPDGSLEECTSGGLSMHLDVRVEADGALVFESRGYFLLVRGLRIAIPAWMTPGTCRVSHQDVGPGQFRFTLDMRHPLWGDTFHQTGVFDDPAAIH
ncbi:DUF4166 domain-containing protein [Diaphorobacter aerolatus]|uniref:DUF4166 domain-containing protein n=1 Tax=Diaphorobacter aerolatus TaxID=1288495 RepID=A0A7H0GK97_9BURK|nr:DUF4166 domain-containing protein [Diaphorobacter aerolatus]QNP48713.1 DUF4166 domain-containing protein [Diaphorobacter aerolatus]